MNETLKAVIIELTGGNIRNHHINLRGAFGPFPDDCLGGNNEASAGKAVTLQIAAEVVDTDIDQTKAIYRERGAIPRLFEVERMAEGDLILIERTKPRTYRASKASKRGLNHYL